MSVDGHYYLSDEQDVHVLLNVECQSKTIVIIENQISLKLSWPEWHLSCVVQHSLLSFLIDSNTQDHVYGIVTSFSVVGSFAGSCQKSCCRTKPGEGVSDSDQWW